MIQAHFEDADISSMFEEKKMPGPSLRIKKGNFVKEESKSKEVRMVSEAEEDFDDISEGSEIM